jgi:hypothetical protein
MSARTYLPAAGDIAAVFEEECRSRGATAVDCYQDDWRVIARCVFGPVRAVRPGDEIRGGVALRAEGPFIFVHPYTWRQVCSNGAIAAQVLGTRQMERVEVDVAVASTAYVGPVLDELRTAIDASAQPARFEEFVEGMRGATNVAATLAIALLPHLLRAHGADQREMIMAILDRQSTGGDPTAYGVFNAMTSLGRDASDHDRRWKLESAGGELLQRLAAPQVRGRATRQALVSA